MKSGENWSSSFREEDVYTILYKYIAQGQGQITPRGQNLIVTEKNYYFNDTL